MKRCVAAVVQLTCVADLAHNLSGVRHWVARAAGRGADLVVLPENFAFMGPEADRVALGESVPGEGPIVATVLELARSHGIHIVAGGLPERSPDPARTYNASLLVTPEGTIVGHYRKIHLFDVAIPDGAHYEESRSVCPGVDPVLVDTELGKVGLSVCYDLRFPELYRALSMRGAEILTVSAAFTLYTGKDHWLPLLQARAIENQCFVLAAAQFGRHDAKRVTYGHSLILDPWGTLLAQAPDCEGLALAELDPGGLDRARGELPALQHRRL